MSRDGFDHGVFLSEVFAGDDLAAARRAAYELACLLGAVLEQTGPVEVPDGYLHRGDELVTHIGETDPPREGYSIARLLTDAERERFRSPEGQAASARQAAEHAARMSA